MWSLFMGCKQIWRYFILRKLNVVAWSFIHILILINYTSVCYTRKLRELDFCLHSFFIPYPNRLFIRLTLISFLHLTHDLDARSFESQPLKNFQELILLPFFSSCFFFPNSSTFRKRTVTSIKFHLFSCNLHSYVTSYKNNWFFPFYFTFFLQKGNKQSFKLKINSSPSPTRFVFHSSNPIFFLLIMLLYFTRHF